MARKDSKGVSLAKGPVGLIGLASIAFGILGYIFGDQSFGASPLDGAVDGKNFLGVELNAWSSLLFVAGGALLLLAAPLHWGAKTMSIVVGLAFGAASVIALVDKQDVFGIFAANGLTKLIWGALAAVLLILALLPRVGGKKRHDDGDVGAERPRSTQRVQRETRTVEREPVRDPEPRVERGARLDDGAASGSQPGSVAAPGSSTDTGSRDTTRRLPDR